MSYAIYETTTPTRPMFRIALPSWRVKESSTETEAGEPAITRDEIQSLFGSELSRKKIGVRRYTQNERQQQVFMNELRAA